MQGKIKSVKKKIHKTKKKVITSRPCKNIPVKSNPSQADNLAFLHLSQISKLEAPEMLACKKIISDW